MAACPATIWTSAPKAATFSLHRPRSALSPTGSSSGSAATAAWTGPQEPGSWNPSANSNNQNGARPQSRDLSHLAQWVASQSEGNRNAGLYWAANRALDADPAVDLSHLATAARKVGLEEPEITRTLDSARKTSQGRNRCSARVLVLHMVRPPNIAGEPHARTMASSRRLWVAVLSSAKGPRRISW
jgi:hypothetical protein